MALSFKSLIGLSFLFLLPLFVEGSEIVLPESQLSGKEVEEVKSGKMVIHVHAVDDNYIKEINAFELIDAPAKNILSMITDYEHLPEFMPNLEAVEVLKEDKHGALTNYILALPFGVSKRYRLKAAYDIDPPELRMAWHSVPWPGLEPEETVKSTSGFWLFIPINENQTFLHYYTKTDPGHVPFGLGWIVDYLTEKAVIELLHNTKERAEKQWQEHQS